MLLPILSPETLSIDNSFIVAHTGPPFVVDDESDPSVPWAPYTSLSPAFPAEKPFIDQFHHIDALSEEGHMIGSFDTDSFDNDSSDDHPSSSSSQQQDHPDHQHDNANQTSDNDHIDEMTIDNANEMHYDDDNAHNVLDDDLIDMFLKSNDTHLSSSASFNLPDSEDLHDSPKSEEGYILPTPTNLRRSQRVRNQRSAEVRPFDHRHRDHSYVNIVTSTIKVPSDLLAESIAALSETIISVDDFDAPGSDPTPFLPEPIQSNNYYVSHYVFKRLGRKLL
jgi:hypothetical protein